YFRSIPDLHRLGGEDHQVAGAGLGGVRGRVYAHRAIARGAFHAQPMGADRVHVLAPAVDRPDFVPGRANHPGVHGAHRPAPIPPFSNTTSNTPAAPLPRPMHMVTTTSFAPRRLPPISAWPTRRPPLMP